MADTEITLPNQTQISFVKMDFFLIIWPIISTNKKLNDEITTPNNKSATDTKFESKLI